MKKDTKNTKAKKQPALKSAKNAKAVKPIQKRGNDSWSWSIYIYWFIILVFISATFFILGQNHGAFKQSQINNNTEITEEALLEPEEYMQTGKDSLVEGDITSAIADFSAVIDAGVANIQTYILRGEAYLQISEFRKALADFDTAIEMDPNNSVAYYDRALLNMRLEDYTAALNDINNALAAYSIQPNNVLSLRDLYAKRGTLNLWLKNWQGAIADYTNSLARPDGKVNYKVYAERAEAYTAIGNYAEAINDYASAVRIISEQISALPTLEERQALSSNAMSYFEKSAALNLNLGDFDSAKSDLESAYTIAGALKDSASMERIKGLLADLDAE